MTNKQITNLFKKFGLRCKEIRLQKGLTQEDMFSLGFSTRFYQRIEAGKPVHLQTVFKLSKAFKVPVIEFFKGV